ncbi:olfactory receptor 1361-like [Microcaecilia unicolor]|uniref:Olfactory receptor n=1 Tax=Microcaecilia unicolor TaxID=1415580 RepID=A0A6P7XDP1_9AMPH|nr:olfactory receptor 1361-like [Microcaecilia unicolor]
MNMGNHSTVTEFILLGMSDRAEEELFLFSLFLIMYLISLLGNTLMITLIITDRHLHTPMYFFLSNLSLVDMSFTSVTVPKMLIALLSGKKTISFFECMTQLYFFITLGVTEGFLLAVMAYDRYVAICNPLRYTIVMSRRICSCLVGGSWIVTSLHALLHTMMVSDLLFCGPNTIHHFFCDILPLLKLSCSDTSNYELVIFTEASVIGLGPFLCILISYVYIIAAILKVRSAEGRRKAFSTCSSHLTIVTLFYGTIIFMYFRPSSAYFLDRDMLVTVMYTVLTPMLNPFIYSLRNKEVKGALRRAIVARIWLQKI